MSTIVTRAGKGSALTHNEVDANFTNLNTDKLQSGNTAAALTITTATFGAGTAAAPAITTSGDTNTGVFFPAADTIAFSEGGVESMRVDSSWRLLVGATTARSNFFNTTQSAQYQIEGTTLPTSAASIVRNSDNTGGSFLVFGKSRGTTVGSNTIVVSGDGVGTISFQGSDGTEFVEAAKIEGLVDGTPGTNDMPGRLVFSTTADGASTPTERMRIDSAGNLGLGATPSAWGSSQRFIDVNLFASFGQFNNTGGAVVASNAFYNGTNWIYKNTNGATRFEARPQGQFEWYNAPSGTAGNAITFTQAMTLDASGRLLVGTTASQTLSNVGVVGNLQIETANGSANATMVRNTANSTGPIFAFGKSRGAALGSRTVVVSGDTLGEIRFDGADGTLMLDAASIFAQVDGTPGTNDMPGRLVFSTTPDGSSTPTEQMRLTSTGDLRFNSGYGSVATAYGCRAWVNFDGTANSNLTGTYSRTSPSTTVTVTITAHGLTTGDSVFLDFTSGTGVDGTYTATVTGLNTFTVTTVASTTTSGNVTLRENTIRASGNVSSVADNGTGDYTVNFTNAMPDANYSISAAIGNLGGSSITRIPEIIAQTAGNFRVNQWTGASTSVAVDAASMNFSIFR